MIPLPRCPLPPPLLLVLVENSDGWNEKLRMHNGSSLLKLLAMPPCPLIMLGLHMIAIMAAMTMVMTRTNLNVPPFDNDPHDHHITPWSTTNNSVWPTPLPSSSSLPPIDNSNPFQSSSSSSPFSFPLSKATSQESSFGAPPTGPLSFQWDTNSNHNTSTPSSVPLFSKRVTRIH